MEVQCQACGMWDIPAMMFPFNNDGVAEYMCRDATACSYRAQQQARATEEIYARRNPREAFADQPLDHQTVTVARVHRLRSRLEGLEKRVQELESTVEAFRTHSHTPEIFRVTGGQCTQP